MRIGVTGHQRRPGIDWAWVSSEITKLLKSEGRGIEAYSSLAAGADQVFAQAALKCGASLVAVIPVTDYENYFSGTDLLTYRKLLDCASVVKLDWAGDPQKGFLAAGKFVVDETEKMIAVWDGQPAVGPGGTGDVVEYSQEQGRPVFHIDPQQQCSNWIQQTQRNCQKRVGQYGNTQKKT